MKGGARFAAMVWLVVTGTACPAVADTFGGQVHAVRAKGTLQGATIERGEGGDPRLPGSLELATDAEIAGADFRFDWMFGDLRLGSALMVFGVRDLKLSPPAGDDGATRTVGDGFGGSLEGFVGYELMQGPVYLYADLRVVLQGFEAPVTARSAELGETTVDYARGSLGAGPRLGTLVPVGHSLMIDFAIYQSILGGLEGTTGFVGLGYWENDRVDAFTDDLNRSFGGDF